MGCLLSRSFSPPCSCVHGGTVSLACCCDPPGAAFSARTCSPLDFHEPLPLFDHSALRTSEPDDECGRRLHEHDALRAAQARPPGARCHVCRVWAEELLVDRGQQAANELNVSANAVQH